MFVTPAQFVHSFDNEIAAARIQTPRSLWDENYTEDSWIGQWFSPVMLIKNINSNISIIAKIENDTGIKNIDDIIDDINKKFDIMK